MTKNVIGNEHTQAKKPQMFLPACYYLSDFNDKDIIKGQMTSYDEIQLFHIFFISYEAISKLFCLDLVS
jgi:hypothetical protein